MDMATKEGAQAVVLDRQSIESILPHRESALILDSVSMFPDENQAIGQFCVRTDDFRINDHFGVMPGHLIAEFAHLTGAVFLLHATDGGSFPMLDESHIRMSHSASPGDTLQCVLVCQDRTNNRPSFHAVIKNQSDDIVATVYFSGSKISRRLFERMTRR